jgi:hypothetical protein
MLHWPVKKREAIVKWVMSFFRWMLVRIVAHASICGNFALFVVVFHPRKSNPHRFCIMQWWQFRGINLQSYPVRLRVANIRSPLDDMLFSYIRRDGSWVTCLESVTHHARERHRLQILTNRRHISAGTKGYFLSLRSFHWFSSKTSFVDFDK